LDHLTTRDIRRIEPGQSAYLSVLTEQGTMADDAIVSNNGGDEWMIVHGSGDTMALLAESAVGKNVDCALNDDLHDLSVQGPKSLEVLNAHCSIDLSALNYFHHAPADLFGHACRLSRTGYSGERGYEVFAGADAICDIWDNLVGAGVMPCSFASLDKVRIEAGLLFYGYDMTTDHTPWEVGLGFTVSRNKSDFRGREALFAAEGHKKILNVGLDIDHSDMVAGGETLSHNGEAVGPVNSPCYSHRLGKSLALGHVSPAAAAPGTILSLSGDGIETTAQVVAMPIYDPQKARTHAD
ncbi:MAG: aminomethyltransferase family protein, partial [Pseudomonadota bacterium]